MALEVCMIDAYGVEEGAAEEAGWRRPSPVEAAALEAAGTKDLRNRGVTGCSCCWGEQDLPDSLVWVREVSGDLTVGNLTASARRKYSCWRGSKPPAGWRLPNVEEGLLLGEEGLLLDDGDALFRDPDGLYPREWGASGSPEPRGGVWVRFVQ